VLLCSNNFENLELHKLTGGKVVALRPRMMNAKEQGLVLYHILVFLFFFKYFEGPDYV